MLALTEDICKFVYRAKQWFLPYERASYKGKARRQSVPQLNLVDLEEEKEATMNRPDNH